MLIRDTDILTEYSQLSGTPNYAGLLPSLRMVEIKYIVPILGQDLYDALDSAITAATEQDPLAEVWTDLLHQCRMAIGPLFCYFHADKADVQFTDAGMQRAESSTNKVAYQEQRAKFKEANLQEGEYALELLQAFLDKKREDYPEWMDSDNFDSYKSLFIKSGTEFNALFPSATPYRNYWLLRATMYDVEQNNIRPFLGDDLFDELKAEDIKKDPEFSDEQKTLLLKIKKAIVNLTVAFAIPFLNVRIGSNGLTVPAITSFSQDDQQNTRAGVDHAMLDNFITSCTNAGTTWLNNANTYLTNNQTTFTNWIGFATTGDDDEESTSTNADLNSSFGMI
jgi:hypothetical protein